VLDRERILAKKDVLDGYLKELQGILPASFGEYKKIEKRRACERLPQVSIECIIDICGLMVTGLRLGLPAEEDDLFEKLEKAGVITSPRKQSLKKMKGFRNILVHEYGGVDDMIVYEVLQNNLNDFEAFKQDILQAIKVR
jgi:uncharacterized protein YutE (UPF0331/DUF86 family)